MNIKEFTDAKDAIEEAQKLFDKYEKFYHVIYDSKKYFIVNSELYSKEYFDKCKKKKSKYTKVYTSSLKTEFGYKKLNDAKDIADKKTRIYGGNWFVIFNEGLKKYIIVALQYIENNKLHKKIVYST